MVVLPKAKGNPLYQTNLFITYKEQPHDFANPYEFLNVHPDNEYRIENGMLSFETLTGDEIIYIPADSILFFYTTCERVGA
jgi:hypothetical protein